MLRIDFKEKFGKAYFPPANEIVAVRIPAMNFAMIDGTGHPRATRAYPEAIEALYGVSYTVKITLKQACVADFSVGPLETLWSTSQGTRGFDSASRAEWRWTAMIMQPPPVTQRRFQEAADRLRERKNPTALSGLRFERFDEGWSAQTTYVGPYSAEAATIQRLHQFIEARAGRAHGRHHEIYLSDPRRTPPSRLKTVLRQPFAR